MSASLGAAHAAAVAASLRAANPEAGPRRLRSIASARAAREREEREALPVGFGGLTTEEIEPMETAVVDVDDAPTPREVPAGPQHTELDPLWSTSLDDGLHDDARVFSVRMSACGTLVAAGCGDGIVRILHASTGRAAYALDPMGLDGGGGGGEGEGVALPATCLRWRAGRALLVAKASGSMERWQAGSTPKRLHAVAEEGNQIYALDVAPDNGERLLATGGKDTAVRVYDEARMQLVLTLGTIDADMRRYEGASTAGHTSRVFALRFCPDTPHLLASAGWDQTVRLWDVRAGTEALRLADAHHVCGDSIDVSANEMVVGAWGSGRLGIYELRTGTVRQHVPWRGAADEMAGCKYYAAQFVAEGGLIAAAGVHAVGGQGEVRVITRDGEVIGRALAPRGVYGVDTAVHPTGGLRVAITGEESVVMLEAPGRGALAGG